MKNWESEVNGRKTTTGNKKGKVKKERKWQMWALGVLFSSWLD